MILCVGMMVCDTLLAPVPQDILRVDSADISKPYLCCGGDALGVAIGLSRLGIPVSIVGRIADDLNGRYILQECNKNGVDTSNVVYDNEYATAASFALIDERGERHYLSERSIFDRLLGEDVPDRAIENADMVYVGSAMAMAKMDAGGTADLFERAHRLGKLTVMDAAIVDAKRVDDWLSYLKPVFVHTDVFFPSLEEAAVLTKEQEPEKIMECFRGFGMKLFGIKLGANGCFVTDFREQKYLPCVQGIPVVDTSGAGDSFMAGLLCGLAHGWNAFDSAAFASCVAAKKISAGGGTSGVPGFDEAHAFYQNWK